MQQIYDVCLSKHYKWSTLQITFKRFYMTAIYRWEEIFFLCTGTTVMESGCHRQQHSQWNHSQIQCLCHTLNSQHPTRALAASPRPVACLRCLNGTPQMRMTRGRRRGWILWLTAKDSIFTEALHRPSREDRAAVCFRLPLWLLVLKRSSIWLHSKQTGDAALGGWCHNLPLTIAWASANTDNLERVLVYFQ